MHSVIVPRLDPAMKTGRIVEWLKRENEAVKKGEPILVVEGEKTIFEIEAPATGVLRKILYPAGSEIEVLTVVAMIGEPGEPIPPDLGIVAPREEVLPPPLRIEKPGVAVVERPVEEVAPASPLARKMAEEYGIDLTMVEGTGPGGRIVKEDVLRAVEERRAAVSAAPLPEVVTPTIKPPRIAKTIPFSGTRKTIAERLSHSFHTAVPVTVTMEVNMEKLLDYYESIKATMGNVSLTALILKAVAKALESHAIFNSTLDGNEIKIFEDINIALAINTPDGLIAPVIRNSNKKSVAEISNVVRELTEKAMQRKLSLEELLGGTFTVTNMGPYDVEIFAPIINPPQSAILGIGRIAKRAVIMNDQIVVKPMATLSLVFDHRVTDGVPAAEFLREVKRLLEAPDLFLSSI